jgi:hypothetical protein
LIAVSVLLRFTSDYPIGCSVHSSEVNLKRTDTTINGVIRSKSEKNRHYNQWGKEAVNLRRTNTTINGVIRSKSEKNGHCNQWGNQK